MSREKGPSGLEWFGFVLGLVGVGLALLAFDPERVKPRQALLFEGGRVLLGLCALLVVWPFAKRVWRRLGDSLGPKPLGMLFDVAAASGVIGDGSEASQRFMNLVTELARGGHIELLGIRSGGLEPIPRQHFDEYSLMTYPNPDGLGRAFRTIRPADFPFDPHDRRAFLQLHVPSGAKRTFIEALAALMPTSTNPSPTPVSQ